MVALAATLERARQLAPRAAGRRPVHRYPVQGIPWEFEPWWAQRMFLRPVDVRLVPASEVAQAMDSGNVVVEYRDGKPFRIVVAGRQSGKTEVAARKLLQIMGTEPGSYSALLAPTYKIAQAAIDKILGVMKECKLEALGWKWLEQKKRLEAPNGSVFAVFSADRKETVRGPTIDGVLWIDEGAFLSETARDAAYGALVGNQSGRVMITTTPCGMNWVHREFTDEDEESVRDTVRIRFRSEDSPYSNKAMIRRLRRKMTKEKGQQEFDAEFVASLFMVFPPEILEQLWVDGMEKRAPKEARNVLGVDLGKLQDWVVVTLGNRFLEFQPLKRWQRTDWPETQRRVSTLARQHNAIVVLDQGAGGGYGDVLADYLKAEENPVRVVMFRTASRGMKAAAVEDMKASAEWGKLSILRNGLFDVYNDELAKFQGQKRVHQGQEITVYEGPQIQGEHDDCPISLMLAHWGSKHAWEGVWEDNSAAGDFLAQPGLGGSGDHDTLGGDFPSYTF